MMVALISGALVLSRMYGDPQRTGATISWLVGMLLVPYLFIPLYLILGGRRIRKLAGRKRALEMRRPGHGGTLDGHPMMHSLSNILENAPAVSSGNAVKFLDDPVECYERLFLHLREAKQSINIMVFILERDEVGKEFVQLLARKAREGVKVRLLLDAVGSPWSSRWFVDPIREAGGEVGVFMPMWPFHRKWSANLRNHRKIYLIDEKIAMTGGRNIGDVYLGKRPRKEYWRDYLLELEGPVIWPLCEIFAADWEFATGEPTAKTMCPDGFCSTEAKGDVTLQTVATGPDEKSETFQHLVLGAMFQAKKRVWVVTPYFVPDEPILNTLMVLARMGLDVRVIVTRRSDALLCDLARRYYLRQLAAAGAKIYYKKGPMLHSKILLVDKELVVLGSPNMDMRSLYLNYEVSLFVYTKSTIAEIDGYIRGLIRGSIRRKVFHSRFPRIQETMENLLRLLAPLL